jgi:DNA repair protein RecO
VDQLQAIVLRAYDVGEADRFCILFTRERGRIAVRATGVRKLKSRIGGTLLPFRHVQVSAREGSGGFFVCGAAQAEPALPCLSSLAAFSQAERGIELLLALVQHEGALPGVFDATLSFLHACHEPPAHCVLTYAARLLHLLGLLPEDSDISMKRLTPMERQFLRSIAAGEKAEHCGDLRQLTASIEGIVREQLTSPLKAPAVLAFFNP